MNLRMIVKLLITAVQEILEDKSSYQGLNGYDVSSTQRIDKTSRPQEFPYIETFINFVKNQWSEIF